MHDEVRESTAVDALQRAPCGIMLLDSAGIAILVNSRCAEMLGAATTELAGVHAPSYAPLAWLFEGRDTGYLPATGSHPALWLCGWREKLAAGGQAIYLIDTTELQQLRAEHERLQQQLGDLDTRDSLTGLANRRALLQHLEPLVSRSRRYGNPLGVIRVRIDDPAQLDQRHGAGTGQSVMLSISRELKDQLRWTDVIGRLDAGEFLLLLPETARPAATALAGKIAARLSAVALTGADGRPVALTARYGVSGWDKGDDSRRLLERAAQLAAQAAPGEIAVG